MQKLIENKWIKIGGILLVGIVIGWSFKPNSQAPSEEDHMHSESLADQLWTCSMHPQIKLNEPGSCPICGMDLIPLSTNSSSANSNPLVYEMTQDAVALANIHTSKVGGSASGKQVRLTGKIQTDERENAAITAKFPGRIEKLYVSFTGEQVRAGQKLASIYSPELMTAQQELIEAAKSKSNFPELYLAAKEKLKLWKLSDQQIASIESSGKIQEQMDVIAEHSGVVTQRNIAVGDYVSTGSVLFNVVNLSKLWVLMDAYESDLPFLKIDDEVSFTAAGIPGETFKAKVSFIDPLINPTTRAVSIRAEISNAQGKLKPEMFVSGTISSNSSSANSELSIPRTALLWTGKRSIVYVKVANSEVPAFEMREVNLGSKVGDYYLIESGIAPGEEIVTHGVFAVDAAAQLSGSYSMMNRPQSKSMEVPEAFRSQITALADAYFEIKNNLASDDLTESQKSAKDAQNSLSGVDMKILEGNAYKHWMQLMKQISTSLTQLETSSGLVSSRKIFSDLSTAILEMTERFGLNKEVVYKDYCPMAFGDQGAYWLSESKAISNPYFGPAMLTCGEVAQTYLKGQTVFETESPQITISSTHTH